MATAVIYSAMNAINNVLLSKLEMTAKCF